MIEWAGGQIDRQWVGESGEGNWGNLAGHHAGNVEVGWLFGRQ